MVVTVKEMNANPLFFAFMAWLLGIVVTLLGQIVCRSSILKPDSKLSVGCWSIATINSLLGSASLVLLIMAVIQAIRSKSF